MSTSQITLKQNTVAPGQAVAPLSYEWLMASCVLLRVFGSYVDLWAHTHIPQLETFFTPWHAVLYGSFALAAAVLVGLGVFVAVGGCSVSVATGAGVRVAVGVAAGVACWPQPTVARRAVSTMMVIASARLVMFPPVDRISAARGPMTPNDYSVPDSLSRS